MLKANKTGTVLDLCRCREMWWDREGKHVGSFGRSARLKPYSTQLTLSILFRTHTVG
jgi:hypothetical protein